VYFGSHPLVQRLSATRNGTFSLEEDKCITYLQKGDRSNPANYRPISLTSVCSKLLEHILHSQIMKHLDHHNILSNQQHVFRKQRATESQLLLTLQDLSSANK
jgi:hypothetical protein